MVQTITQGKVLVVPGLKPEPDGTLGIECQEEAGMRHRHRHSTFYWAKFFIIMACIFLLVLTSALIPVLLLSKIYTP